MSRPFRFWLWTVLSAALFSVGCWRLNGKLDFTLAEALLYSGAVSIAIWVIGLRILIGGKGPLPTNKLRNPHLATPEEFELLCAEIYRKRGYKVELTSAGGDYGADVIARKGDLTLIIGAKRYDDAQKVGNRWVQQLLGSMPHFNADMAVLITTSGFTKQAVEQAADCPIELIDREELSKIIRNLWM